MQQKEDKQKERSGPADVQCYGHSISGSKAKKTLSLQKHRQNSIPLVEMPQAQGSATATKTGGAQGEHLPAHPVDLALTSSPFIAPRTMSNHPMVLQCLSGAQEGHWKSTACVVQGGMSW